MFNDLLADVVGLEPSEPCQIATSSRETTIDSLPNKPNAAADTLLIFQYLGGGDLAGRKDIGEERFKLLLTVSTAFVAPTYD